MPIIAEQVTLDSIARADVFKAHTAPDADDFRHCPVDHPGEGAVQGVRVEGMELF